MGAPGFDDAPFVQLSRGQPKDVTFIYPYYENPVFLQYHLMIWDAYPDDLRSRIRVVIVDDGSPVNPASDVLSDYRSDLSIRLFRIEVDVRWNWLAARNIGMRHATTEWCLLTDMDHVVRMNLADALVYENHLTSMIYRLSRVESSEKPIHPHPNSMFMTRDMFWHIGGYDETLSGHYGTDGDWRRRCVDSAWVRTLRHSLVRHEFEKDSSTTRYLRKQPEDAGKKRLIAQRGNAWKPKVLSFPYHEVGVRHA